MSNLSEITDPVSDDRADSAEAARDCEESKENTDKKRALDDAPDWNRPEWFVVGKHDLLNPNLQKLGGFPVTRAKLAGVGADVAIVDGIRDFATGEIEMRSVTGKPAAKAEPPNGSKNYFYFPYVDGKQHQHALYGTVYGDFRFRKGDVQYRDEYTAKVKLDNVSCEDLELFQGKPPYRKEEDTCHFVEPAARGVEASAAFRASVEAFQYPHAVKVSSKLLGDIGFFDEVPDEAALGDKRGNRWVNRLVRDVLGTLDTKKKWDPLATEYRNIMYKTGFSFPFDVDKDPETNVVREYRNYSAPDGKVTFSVQMPVYTDPEAGFLYEASRSKQQALDAVKGKAKPMEIKKIAADGTSTHPDADELMADFGPETGAKHVMVLFKYLFTQHEKKGAPTLKPKVVKYIYTVADQAGAEEGGEDFV